LYKLIGGTKKDNDDSFPCDKSQFTELMNTQVGCDEQCAFKLADGILAELIKEKIEAGQRYPPDANPIVILLDKNDQFIATIQPKDDNK